MMDAVWNAPITWNEGPQWSIFYLQVFATMVISGYMLREWSRLMYRTHRKMRERPGLLILNWSWWGISRKEKSGKEEVLAPSLDNFAQETDEETDINGPDKNVLSDSNGRI